MKHLILLLCLLPPVFSSCFTTAAKEYESIHGRHYRFQKIFFHQKGATHSSIFKAMNDIQLPKIMRLLEHKYGITVDYSEFDLFLFNKDPMKINADGLLSNVDFYWQSGAANPNSIELEVLFTEQTGGVDADKDFIVTIKAENSTKARIYGSFVSAIPSIPEIASRLGYKRSVDEIYVNTGTNEQIDLNSKSDSQNYADMEISAEKNYIQKRMDIQSQMKEHYDSLPVKDRERYKEDIINFLNGIDK
ncbi:MAG: hypothetical protein LBT84_03610 [Spirochaetia bacterium]|jgi:hypothetical protein|nr:hypothetical protein [Spirochaetia bacterium]